MVFGSLQECKDGLGWIGSLVFQACQQAVPRTGASAPHSGQKHGHRLGASGPDTSGDEKQSWHTHTHTTKRHHDPHIEDHCSKTRVWWLLKRQFQTSPQTANERDGSNYSAERVTKKHSLLNREIMHLLNQWRKTCPVLHHKGSPVLSLPQPLEQIDSQMPVSCKQFARLPFREGKGGNHFPLPLCFRSHLIIHQKHWYLRPADWFYMLSDHTL